MTQQPDQPEQPGRPGRVGPQEPERDERTGKGAAAERIRDQARWVDLQVQQAMARGEFDDLPGAGKPLQDLDGNHDPDWWVKRLIEREQLTGLAPPALSLRQEDARFDDRLDRETAERSVRRLVEDFNARIIEARRQLAGGPPVVTPTRDVDGEVEAWRARREARRAAQRAALAAQESPEPRARPTGRRWWQRR